LPSNTPWISAMSISAEPLKAPCWAIWITRESIVASTRPSTTRVSQSVISTPLSLMFGPTVSLLPPSGTVVEDAAVLDGTVALGSGTATLADAEEGWPVAP
jgi:hypothetical protein